MTSAKSKKKGRRGRRFLFLLVVAALLGGGAAALKWWRDETRAARVAALLRRRDALRERLLVLAAKDPVLAAAPDADVLLGVPERVGAEMIGGIATGYFGDTRLELHDLRVRKSGRAQAKTLIGRVTPGYYALDLRIHEIRGVLVARTPTVSFEGDRVALTVPVRVTRGEGRGTLDFRWDSRGLAGAVCGDFRTRVAVAGTVVPQTYVARGRFDLGLADGRLTAQPVFPKLKFRIHVEPTPKTWRAVDRVIGERGAGCRAAMKLVKVRGLLRRLLQKGFSVTVPQKIFRKPLRLRATLRREVTLGGRSYRVELTPRALAGTPGFLWYGADVSLVAERVDGVEVGGLPGRPQPEDEADHDGGGEGDRHPGRLDDGGKGREGVDEKGGSR
jgi:hypothetical protein